MSSIMRMGAVMVTFSSAPPP